MEFSRITSQNLEQLRTLNLATFPVRYVDKFYENVLNTPNEISMVLLRASCVD